MLLRIGDIDTTRGLPGSDLGDDGAILGDDNLFGEAGGVGGLTTGRFDTAGLTGRFGVVVLVGAMTRLGLDETAGEAGRDTFPRGVGTADV